MPSQMLMLVVQPASAQVYYVRICPIQSHCLLHTILARMVSKLGINVQLYYCCKTLTALQIASVSLFSLRRRP